MLAGPRTRSQSRPEAGFTLVEVMVTVTIMSLAFVTILEGQAVFFHSTTVRRATASLDTAARSYSTALNNVAYVDCANSYAPVPQAGSTAAVAIDYWNGDIAPASFTDRTTCLANGDHGVQRLRLTLTDTATSQVDQLTIVKRKP
jgi:prepilin-type N-terminal cleavage/methylation domain-containing protein